MWSEIHGWQAIALIYGALIGGSFGLPISEELTLLTAGYTSHLERLPLVAAMATGWLGVLCGNSIVYGLGRSLGARLTRTRWGRRILPEERLRKARVDLSTKPRRVLIVGRLLPILRLPVYFSAGTLALPYRLFFLIDFCTTLATVPLVVWAGYLAGDHFDDLVDFVQKSQGAVAILVIAAILGYVLWRRSRRTAPAEPGEQRAVSEAPRVSVAEGGDD